MKPTMEKMTKPANMLVQELMQHTMMESLYTPGRSKRFFKEGETSKQTMMEATYLYTSLW